MVILVWSTPGLAVTIAGGAPKKKDCITQMTTAGVAFPAGKAPAGATCADGDVCDADGLRNGSCQFPTAICTNVPSDKCAGAEIKSISLKAGKASSQTAAEVSALAGAAASLPPTGPQCTAELPVTVPVSGPNGRGEFSRGLVKIQSKTKTDHGGVKDEFQLVCLPATAPPPTGPSPTTTTTTTTTTLPPIQPPPGAPGAGLEASITGATVNAGTVVVTFTLTDEAGVAVTPVAAATTNPDEARVRFTIARINVIPETAEGFTTTFYEYFNYITTRVTSGQVSSNQPTYDSGGTFVTVDALTGTYTYTFKTTLPADFPATLTHTVGAQIERTFADERLIANPLFDFVPAGGTVTTVIQDTTTAQCNSCHDPLQAHGGGRREVGLCILCHTDQAIDPDSGNTIDFRVMVHKIHTGKDLPTVLAGPFGTNYSIIGRGGPATFGEKVKACVGGPLAGIACETDADCGTGGVCSMRCVGLASPGATCGTDGDCRSGETCTGGTTEGVGFPQDLRNCTKCHGAGETANYYKNLPSAAACASCHDDVNPSDADGLNGLPKGANHLPGPQPDAWCRVCHVPSGPELALSVTGAHTNPNRSTQLTGLVGELVGARVLQPSREFEVRFKITNGAGTPLSLAQLQALNRVAIALSGPTVPDLGGFVATPVSAPLASAVFQLTIVGGGAAPTLSGPDVDGVFTYVTTGTTLPAGAGGSWRVGLEARQTVTITSPPGSIPAREEIVSEALQNPVLDFSVDGSPVQARRVVVDIENCGHCHGTFSKDFSVHGNLRNQTQYCVVCHNPNVTDFARRRSVPDVNPQDEPINLKHLVHKIHTGEELANKPYVVYGFGSRAVELSEVRYPGDRRDCAACHVVAPTPTYLLPLQAGLLPTIETMVSGATQLVTGHTPPVQDACLTCHDSADVQAHAETMTTSTGAEACGVCHGEGAQLAVSTVHANRP